MKYISILTPENIEIEVPESLFRMLRKGGFLYWNPSKSLRQLHPTIYGWANLFAGFDPTRGRSVHAFDYSKPQHGRRETLADVLRKGAGNC